MKKRYQVLLGLLILIVLVIAGEIWVSANWLTVNHYEFATEKAENDVRLVVLSDLHDREFGKDNKRLIEKVREQNPDAILMAGDFLNKSSDDSEIPCKLIEEISEVAPVYFSLGNQEEEYIRTKDEELIAKLESAGAVVLEEDYKDIEIKGTPIRLGGMYAYAFGTNAKSGENEGAEIAKETGMFLKEFQNTDRIKIMMAHRPDSFIFGDAASYWDVDLVVSGHNHGGQVVVPFKGGLYAGDQGWFPKYVHGMYQKDKIQLFISSGLGSDRQKVPRFHNIPEIAVVTVKRDRRNSD